MAVGSITGTEGTLFTGAEAIDATCYRDAAVGAPTETCGAGGTSPTPSAPPPVPPSAPPPDAAPPPSSSGGGDEGCGGGCIGGIIGGCFVPVLMLTLWMGNVFESKGCPSPCKKAAKDVPAAATEIA